MPLMGSLYIGASGLQTSQNALNTTAHNLSNVDTKGYSRQQALQATREYNTISFNKRGVSDQQLGLGTYYSKVKQVRHYFLDQAYRKEAGRSAFFETYATSLEEVETLLGEMQGASFGAALSDLWTAVQSLANDPADSVGKGLLVNRASVFLERAQSVYAGLSSYQDNLNLQIKTNVDKINAYGKQLKYLNDQVRKVETGNVETANDVRDARNQVLDELSKLAKISYDEDMNGNVWVQIEGVDFVTKDQVYEIGMEQDVETGFYTPYWTQNAKTTIDASGNKVLNIEGAKLYNTSQKITSVGNTDIGALKALILNRGDKRADYTDLDDSVYDHTNTSTIMKVQAQFDAMVHNIVTKMNELIADASDASTGYLCETDAAGNVIPIQLFQKKGTVGYDPAMAGTPGYDADGYMLEDPTKPDTLYTLENLKLNPMLVSEPTKLDMLKPDGSYDYDLGAALKKAFEEEVYTLNPEVKTPCSLKGFYDSLVIQVGSSGSVFRSMAETQETELESITFAREGIMGVSSDEELSNMIKFQNAYNAASRYINVVDEMLEHILNTLGA